LTGKTTDKGGSKVVDLEAKRARANAGTRQSLNDVRAALRGLGSYNPVLFGVEAGGWGGGLRMPPHSPVVALGTDESGAYFLSARGTITKLPSKAGKGDIDFLFAPFGNYPVWAWPRWTKGKKGEKYVQGNYNAEEARMALFAAAADAGPWDPIEQVRGRGAWLVPDASGGPPELVLHLGDRIERPDGEVMPGVIDDHVYPGRPRIPGPVPASTPGLQGGSDGPGQALFSMLTTWNWARNEKVCNGIPVDAALMMGWIACAFIGGSLRWRPFVFVTGDQGAGKSFLLEFVEAVLGDGGLLKSEDATEAGIAQTLGFDALPVLLDEMENEADGRKAQNIVKMARRAASGSQRIRGGQDHTAASFLIRSCFLFAAINMPTMGPQDMARMAMLSLREIKGKRSGPKPDLVRAAALGRALHRRIVDWCSQARFHDVLETFRSRLISEGGHNDRGADTFGFLLTGYWCALHDDLPAIEDVDELIGSLHRDQLAEYEAIMPEWRSCFNHMMAKQPRALERQSCSSVGAILREFRAEPSLGEAEGPHDGIDAGQARRLLEKVGLTLKWEKGQGRFYGNARLFVPLSDPATAQLFDRTKWGAQSDENPGGWCAALRGGPEEFVVANDKARIGRIVRRGVSLKIAPLIGYQYGDDNWTQDEDGED